MNGNDETLKKLNYERMLAVHEESVIRESCFLPITFDICGIEVSQFTFHHYILLDFMKNGVLNPTDKTEQSDVLMFLWIISTKYIANNKEAFDKFVKETCKDLDYSKVLPECFDYLNKALLDLEFKSDNKKTNKTPYYSWIATYVDLLASEYGWAVEYICGLPIAMVLQLARVIEERTAAKNGNKVTFSNKLSDEASKAILQHINEKAKEENKVVVLPDTE